jgi:hypothetical protein
MQDQRLRGRRAYSASRSLLRSVSFSGRSSLEFWAEASEVNLSTELSTDMALLDFVFDTKWLGKGRYKIYKLK